MDTPDTATRRAAPAGRSTRIGIFAGKVRAIGVDRWLVHATALSFYSILGVVPFLALCFAIAKSFGLEQALADGLYDFFTAFEGQEEILVRLRQFSDNLIDNYSGSVMAFSAIGLMFWSGFQILRLVEAGLGSVFGYRPKRRVLHRALDYFATMVILPSLIVLTAGVNLYLTALAAESWIVPYIGLNPSGFLSFIVVVSPYVAWWLVLTCAYAYFSRGLARLADCVLGGLAASLAFQVFQGVYITVMISLTNYNAIYGSFAAIPLFMFWLYGSWLIVLAGGEITRRIADLFAVGMGVLHVLPPITWQSTVSLAIAVMEEVDRNFSTRPDHGPTSYRDLSKATGASMARLGPVVTRLIACNLLVEIASPTGGRAPHFLPGRNPEQISDTLIRDRLAAGVLRLD